MSEIVERLKSMYITHTPSASYAQVDPVTIGEAANEIDRLEAENAALASDRDGYVKLLTDQNNALEARVKELEGELVVWRNAYKTGRNEPLVQAFEHSAALAQPAPEKSDTGATWWDENRHLWR
jgi:hypothetical protein